MSERALRDPGRSSVLPAAEEKRQSVQSMFDRIAPRYDLLNRLLTLGLDQRWRRLALDTVGVSSDDLVPDIACGTGDLAEASVARGARVIGLDFAREMLRGAFVRGVPSLAQADAQQLPVADGIADVITCGFALRNFADLEVALAEMARVLAPGGRIALVEVDAPDNALLRLGHRLHFEWLVPAIGGLLSDRSAYRYLPESTVYLPPRAELLAMIERQGFEDVRRKSLGLGAAQLLTARKRAAS